MRDYWIKQLKQRPGNAVVPVESAKDPKPRKTGKAPHHIETFGNSDDELINAEQRGGKSFVTVRGHDPKVPGASTLLSSNERPASLDTTSNFGSGHLIWLDPQLHQINNPGPQTSITPTGQGIGTSETPPPEVPVPSPLSYETVELIALHLACTPNFHQMMRSDGKMPMRSLDKNWLCGLDLPERQIPELTNDTAWLAHYQRRNYDEAIKRRATEIFEQLPKMTRTPLEKPIKGPAPVVSDHWIAIREDLFRYHEARWDLLDTEKRLDELRNTMLNAPLQEHSKRMLTMERAERDCQTALLATTLERTVAREIDNLLSWVSESFSASVYQGSGLCSHEAAINKVMELYDVDFGRPKQRSKFSPFNRWNDFSKAADLQDYKYPITCKPLSSTLSASTSFMDHDKRLAAEVSFIFEEVNRLLFETNFHAFMGVNGRLDHMKAMAPQESRDLDPRDLLHDNLAHARLYFDKLKAISDDGLDQSPLDQIWRRIVAIIALCYGCTSESAFFLSTMDHQLSALRESVGKLPFVCS